MEQYKGFAGLRTKGRAQWFVDGKDYMEAVADAIQGATKEIYFTDWQMNHHIYLKRPDSKNPDDWEQWRLGNLLKKKASEGVRVYILLYQEALGGYFLELGSEFTKEELHDPPRINVYRHRPEGFLPIYSHHEKLVVVDHKIAFMGGLDLAYGRWDTPAHKLNDNPMDRYGPNVEYWKGKDYKNTFLMKKDYADEDYRKPDVDFMNRSKEPRMPWHDVACCVEGPAVTDFARHFVQRYNYESEAKKLPVPEEKDWDLPELNCQVVRSYWSRQTEKEASVQAKYHALIEQAEESIYIENQFFISSLKGTLENTVVRSLGDRIIRAHKEGKSFKVIIVIPLKPEMLGTWEDSDELVSVAYLNYATIERGKDSLFNRLKDAGITNVNDYVSTFGLRSYDWLNGKPVTEIVYVHTKLMIVDDKYTIMGSANINDRSMVGDRDSELAVMIESKEFSHGLRCQLTREHLGLVKGDAIADNFETSYVEFMKRADTNTEIFKRVFGKDIEIVDDVVKLEDLRKRKELGSSLAEERPEEAYTQLKDIRGHIVWQPLNFLREYLSISGKFYWIPGADIIIKGHIDPLQNPPIPEGPAPDDHDFFSIC